MVDRIFVSNCTPQKIDFYYRSQYLDPDQQMTNSARRGVRPINILSGEQNKNISLPDGSLPMVEPQLAQAGFIPVESVNSSALRSLGQILGIFSQKQIPHDRWVTVVLHNREVLTEDGRLRRQNAAIANTDQLLETLRKAGMAESNLPPAMVVEYEQDVESEQEGRGRLTEGIVVRPNPGKPRPQPAPTRRTRQAAARNGA
jgi:hypothetical protein